MPQLHFNSPTQRHIYQHMHVKCRWDMQDTVGLGRAEMELNLVEAARLVLQLGKLVFRVPAHFWLGV